MSGRKLVVIAAVIANVVIAITKFVAAAVSGSSGMLSEALHSLVDTGDGFLLMIGMRRSKRPPNAEHPYGHGSEVYFWSMMVAMSIFGMGGGVSIYEGIRHLAHPRAPDDVRIGLIVLAVAFVFEGTSWIFAQRGFKRVRGRRGVWEAIQRGKDPTAFAVVLEDSAALVGITFAAGGLALTHWLDQPIYDALASILIGLLLLAVGAVLGRETWSLVVGESATRSVVDAIHDLAAHERGVRGVRSVRTLHVGPETVHVDLDLELAPDAAAVDITRRIEAAVTRQQPMIKRVQFRFPA